MKLPSVFSCAVLILLLLSSSSATSSTLQNQAVREQELSAALQAGNGVIIIGGTDDFVKAPGVCSEVGWKITGTGVFV